MNLDIDNRYSIEKFGKRTAETMKLFIDSMKKTFTDIDSAWISSLDQLAMNFKLMFDAYDDILANGNISTASKERLSRNPSISLFFNCQNAIQTILTKSGLTVMSKAKVKQLMRDDGDTDEFMENFDS